MNAALPVLKLFRLLSQQLNWPVPLDIVLKLRWLAGTELLGLPEFSNSVHYDSSMLKDKSIAAMFSGVTFSTWSLDIDVLNVLIKMAKKEHPQAILEFGSGVSTICFAYLMRNLSSQFAGPRLFSIEQNPEYLDSTQQRLRELGLEQMVKFHCAPVREQTIEGLRVTCYDLPTQVLDGFLDNTRPDFILVDGPSGKNMARFGTLPLVRKHIAKNARFFLDDALRNDELNVSREWRKLPYVRTRGIYFTGKGLLVGAIC